MTPFPAISRRLALSALGLATMCALTGCFPDPGENVEGLQEVPRAEAMRMADEYANRTVMLIGGSARLQNPETLTPPCDGPGGTSNEKVYFAAGHYQIAPIPEDQQITTLRRLRDQFQREGYTVKQDRVFANGTRGELTVVSPTDEFEISLVSTRPPTALALTTSSPCYYSDEPYPAPLSPSPDR